MVGGTSPCKGEEQVVDVELDRDTIILPVKTGYPPITSKIHWDTVKTNDQGITPEPDQEIKEKAGGAVVHIVRHILTANNLSASESTTYQEILQTLLSRFPMTMKGTSTP